MDDSEILAQANDSIKQQQRANRESSDSRPVPRTLAATMDRILSKIPEPVQLTPEQAERDAANRERWLREQADQKRRERIGAVVSMVGKRYRNATLDTFQATSDEQKTVVGHVREYAENIEQRAKDGAGLFLIGPPGTGKDHLMIAVLKAASVADLKVLWTDGMELFAGARDNIDANRTEAAWLSRYTAPDVLAISDPVPPLGEVKEGFQLATLFSIIDRRYRDMRPTLMTLNVASREEAEKRMSVNIVDRLAHGALVLRCNWPSFRR